MKKKMLITIIIVIAGILLLAAGWHIMFTYLGIGPVLPFMKVEKAELNPAGALVSAEAPLMALVNTQEEAEELAGQYEIELVSYEDGIALYQTEEDLYAVIARGAENDYPPLSINYVRTIDEITDEQTIR